MAVFGPESAVLATLNATNDRVALLRNILKQDNAVLVYPYACI